jgi:hypothetical protein
VLLVLAAASADFGLKSPPDLAFNPIRLSSYIIADIASLMRGSLTELVALRSFDQMSSMGA